MSEYQDWGGITREDNALNTIFNLEPFGEREKFQLAKWLLFGVGLLFMFAGLSYLLIEDRGGAIFEASKTILPPIATLVIGYYFSERASSRGV